MTEGNDLLDLVASGLRLIAREREAFLHGSFEELDDLAEKKERLVDALTAAEPGGVEIGGLRDGLEALISGSRHNAQLMRAAQSGLLAAQRRIDAILATRNGLVAYDENGEEIVSREDAAGKTSRA
jgi:hypothetical protein